MAIHSKKMWLTSFILQELGGSIEADPIDSDDQELDSRESTATVYWEGAVKLTRDDQPAGQGYLELTGYVEPLEM